MMNLDEVTAAWRSEDVSPLFGVDKTLLHQALRQERAKLDTSTRRMRWVGYVGSATLVMISGSHLAIMCARAWSEPTYAAALSVWDYAIGVASVAAALTVTWAIAVLRRMKKARDEKFGDSLRDHLRRRIAVLDDEATREARLASITLVAGLFEMWAIPFVMNRTNHVPSQGDWPSPLAIVLTLAFLWWVFSQSIPRDRQKKIAKKRQLETLLKELDGQ